MNTIMQNDDAREKLEQVQNIFKEISVQRNIVLTEQKILDILSLVPNVSKIDGEKIFIHWKKKHGGTLDIEKFLGK